MCFRDGELAFPGETTTRRTVWTPGAAFRTAAIVPMLFMTLFLKPARGVHPNALSIDRPDVSCENGGSRGASNLNFLVDGFVDPAVRNLTELLSGINSGKKDAWDELMQLVYSELRELAHRRMIRERPGHTLQPTELVHEVYARLVQDQNVHWKNRRHFFAAAGRAMEQILIEHARRLKAAKRGAGRRGVSLEREGLRELEAA